MKIETLEVIDKETGEVLMLQTADGTGSIFDWNDKVQIVINGTKIEDLEEAKKIEE